MFSWFKAKKVFLGVSITLLALFIACGDDPTPVPQEDIGALIRDAVSDLDTGISAQELQTAIDSAVSGIEGGATAAQVQAAIDAAVGGIEPGASAADVQAAVDAAVGNIASTAQVQAAINDAVGAIQPGASAADVQAAIDAAVGNIEPGATMAQVQAAINSAVGSIEPGATMAQVQEAISSAVGAIEPGATAEEVQSAIESALLVKPEGTLRIAVTSLVENTHDPALESGGIKKIFEPIYDWLVGVNADHTETAATGVARAWESNEDFTEWTFYIREGLTFNNGEELNAEDVVWSIQRFLDKGLGSSDWNTLTDTILTMEATNAHTVVFTTEPYFLFPFELSYAQATGGVVLPKDYITEVGDEEFNLNPVGSGPYRLKEHIVNSHVEYEAIDAPHFRVGVPKYKTIRLEIVPDQFTRLAMLKRGQVDIAEISREFVPDARDSGFTILEKADSLMLPLFMFQQWHVDNPLGDSRVRKALIQAIDKQTILDTLFEGSGSIRPNYPVGSWSLGYDPDLPVTSYDLTAAQANLADAGHAAGFDINFYYWVGRGVNEMPDVVQAICAGWQANINVSCNIIPTDIGNMVSNWRDGTFTDPAVNIWISAQSPLRHGSAGNLFRSSGGLTLIGDSDPEMEAVSTVFCCETTSPAEYVAAARAFMQMGIAEKTISEGLWTLSELYAGDPAVVPGWNLGRMGFELNLAHLFTR